MKPKFSIPKLIKYDNLDKTWYVYFRYDGKVVKKTEEMNRIRSRKERLQFGEVLAAALHQRLKEGWNPIVKEAPVVQDALPNLNTYTLYQGLVFAMEKKKPEVAPKTYSGYDCTFRFCKTAISNLGLGNLLLIDAKRVHIKLILEDIALTRKWSSKAYNKGLDHIQAILSMLVEWELLEYNIAYKIKPKTVEESIANVPPTLDEYNQIKEHLTIKHLNYFIYVAALFHTGIRPVELTRLKLSMINVTEKLIVLPPGIVKNRKRQRIVPINPHLWVLLEPFLAFGHPGDWYLFGSSRISGKGNVGKFTDFIPGPTQLKRDTATKRWKRIVKDELGINVNQYAMKHFGADMKILAGVSLEALKELYGHSSKVTTETYAKSIKMVYRNELLELSPAC